MTSVWRRTAGTGRPYGSDFPPIRVADIVNVHRLLLRQLGIERLAAVIGGSFGGMQVLDWALRYPEMIDRCVCIASALSLSAQALAFDVVGRNSIMSDPAWQGGHYYAEGRVPAAGLAQARKLGHITYLSPEIMAAKFGRNRHNRRDARDGVGDRFRSNFEVERYLDHQGRKFVDRFDANSYLYITAAMDDFDLEDRYGGAVDAFARIRSKFLVVALSSDWLFPPEQSRTIASGLIQAGKPVSYCLLQAPHGHDAFLVDVRHLADALRAFLPWVGPSRTAQPAGAPRFSRVRAAERKREHCLIADMVETGAAVLDIGCGSGELLAMLEERKKVRGIGIDIDIGHVIDVLDCGCDVLQEDVDSGLAMIPDDTYDYAVMCETLQAVHQPRFVLHEMLRVARCGIVSFPNFGKWSHRAYLGVTGRMPKGGALPYEWYNTPNIHLFSLRDFLELCDEDGIVVLDSVCLPRGPVDRMLLACGACNAGAERILVKLTTAERAAARGAPVNRPCRRR